MNRSFTVVPVRSPLHDERALAPVLASYAPAFAALGGRLASHDEAPAGAGAGPVVAFVLTGGTEARLLELWQQRQALDQGDGGGDGAPFVLVAHPGHNSLPAALEAIARVHQLGARGRVVVLHGPADASGLGELAEAVDDLVVRARLRRSRIGLLGAPSDWLVASCPDHDAVRRRWGPEIVAVGLDDVERADRRAPVLVATVLARDLHAGVRSSEAAAADAPGAEELVEAARLVPALRSTVDRLRLDAVSVRCFDLLTTLGTSGCVGLSALNDAGVVAGCEGDLASTVAMLWVRALLDQPAWMANPADADPVSGTLLLAHCTVPRSMVRDYGLRTHFESGIGVALEGTLDEGPVTLLRIGGTSLERLWVVDGEAQPTPHREDLCRTQLLVRTDPAAVRELLTAPLGNHVVVVRGAHAARMRRWWERVVSPC